MGQKLMYHIQFKFILAFYIIKWLFRSRCGNLIKQLKLKDTWVYI
jgi:hypothetical protein